MPESIHSNWLKSSFVQSLVLALVHAHTRLLAETPSHNDSGSAVDVHDRSAKTHKPMKR